MRGSLQRLQHARLAKQHAATTPGQVGFYELGRGWALSSRLFELYRKFGYERMKVFMANLANIAQQAGQVRTHAGVARNLLEAARLSGGDAMVSYLNQTWRVQ